MITVKQAVDQASREIGIVQAPVTQAIGSLDQDISQMTALLSAVADEVLIEQPYRDTIGDGYWLLDLATGSRKSSPTADTDYVLFDARLMVNGLKYRFLKAKGLEYGEEMRDYADRMNKLAGKQNAQVIDLDSDWSPVQ
jgi:hypothetical protein